MVSSWASGKEERGRGVRMAEGAEEAVLTHPALGT